MVLDARRPLKLCDSITLPSDGNYRTMLAAKKRDYSPVSSPSHADRLSLGNLCGI